MKQSGKIFTYLAIILFLLLFTMPVAAEEKYIYDNADIFSEAEESHLAQLAEEYSEENEVSFLIVTDDKLENHNVIEYTQDFYDEKAPGYKKEHGDTAMLTIDMENEEVYLAGFGDAMKYLSDKRLDQIREQITPDLSAENFAEAGTLFFEKVDQYLEVSPLVNPDGILLKTWFQLLAALIIGAIVVGSMIFNMGGRVTVNHQTYMDPENTRVTKRRDTYLRKTVTKTRIPKNNSGSSGGGGRTSGGHSHTGSRGGF